MIPNAIITLRTSVTNVTQNGKSGSTGAYRFALVPPGSYQLCVKASGFTEKEIRDIKVDPSEEVPVNVTLAIASSTMTVQVESVSEFTVLTNNMSAQYEHAAGALVIAI